MEKILFTCGSSLKRLVVDKQPSDPASIVDIFDCVFMHKNLTCYDCIKVPYYFSEKFEDICVHCACAMWTDPSDSILFASIAENKATNLFKRKMFKPPTLD